MTFMRVDLPDRSGQPPTPKRSAGVETTRDMSRIRSSPPEVSRSSFTCKRVRRAYDSQLAVVPRQRQMTPVSKWAKILRDGIENLLGVKPRSKLLRPSEIAAISKPGEHMQRFICVDHRMIADPAAHSSGTAQQGRKHLK